MLPHRPVLVMEMPEQLNSVEAQAFLRELKPLLDCPRPRIILDCSAVRHIDGAGVAMMLHCLEEAMNHDGDLKLAALPGESEAVMELRQRFEAFPTCHQAVSSFKDFTAAQPKDSSYANDFGNRGSVKKAS
jgi:anti-anti-sigma factor